MTTTDLNMIRKTTKQIAQVVKPIDSIIDASDHRFIIERP